MKIHKKIMKIFLLNFHSFYLQNVFICALKRKSQICLFFSFLETPMWSKLSQKMWKNKDEKDSVFITKGETLLFLFSLKQTKSEMLLSLFFLQMF